MKLKEKLATEYVETLKQVRVTEFYAKPDISEVSFRPGLEDSYLAGFEKARELALRIWQDEERHVYCDFYYSGDELITLMGEEEC